MPWLTTAKVMVPKKMPMHRAEAAGQQHAADDHRDDGVEDVVHAAGDLRGIEQDRLAHADKGAR